MLFRSTPEMLPAIVVVSLSIGARMMAAKSVLVKRLDAIEDIGAMTILCCDKTGTLTRGVVELDKALDVHGEESARVLTLAAINAGLQQGYPNPLDVAISRRQRDLGGVQLVAEVPYDFERRRLSVLASDGELISKGAYESVLACCSHARTGNGVVPIEAIRGDVQKLFTDLSAQGFRVLAVATRELPDIKSVTAADESRSEEHTSELQSH